MTDTGDVLGAGIGLLFAAGALSLLNRQLTNVGESVKSKPQKREMKREKDYWEETFG